MNKKDVLIKKLKKYHKEDIIITRHTSLKAIYRGIDLEEVKENIIKPDKLQYAEEQIAEKPHEEKYNCYFHYSKTQAHRYALVINKKCIVCTIIKINRRWQHTLEKNAKI